MHCSICYVVYTGILHCYIRKKLKNTCISVLSIFGLASRSHIQSAFKGLPAIRCKKAVSGGGRARTMASLFPVPVAHAVIFPPS